MRISDWSSDVCSSDLDPGPADRMAVDHIHLSHRALDGFARIGSIVVGLLILSGVVNSWILVGPSRLGSLFTSLYGALLTAKLLLFGAMLILAAANRFFLTPALAMAVESGDARSEEHTSELQSLMRI